MADPYSELTGGSGRSARFRARRFRARELSGGATPSVELGDLAVRLHDVSRTGAAVHVPLDTGPAAGERVALRVHFHGEPAFEAHSEVVRHEPGGKVALRFLDRLFDLEEVRSLGRRLVLDERLRQGLAVYQAVPVDYRRICAEVALFLNHWRETLGAREALLPEGPAGAAERAALEASLLPGLRAEWGDLRAEANRISNQVPDEHPGFAAAKRMTELQVTPLLRPSPFLWRCYEKPLGYPGDYVAMGWMYERARQADTLFGGLLDELGYDERLAATVPDRKRLLTGYLKTLVTESPTDRTLRVLNLGAGPAGEIEDFLREADSLRPVTFVLVDQDEDALALAHDRLRQAALRHGDAVRIECRYLSFRQLFSRADLLAEVEDLDLLYSAGLFDYLPEPIGADLMRRCARLLRPGGHLAVGNAAQAEDVRWIPEFVLDWHMLYRDEADMQRLARSIDVPVVAELGRDASQAWHFLSVRRQ